MGGEAGVLDGTDGGDGEGRRCIHAGIHEQHPLPVLQVEGVFHLQLEVGEALDAW